MEGRDYGGVFSRQPEKEPKRAMTVVYDFVHYFLTWAQRRLTEASQQSRSLLTPKPIQKENLVTLVIALFGSFSGCEKERPRKTSASAPAPSPSTSPFHFCAFACQFRACLV